MFDLLENEKWQSVHVYVPPLEKEKQRSTKQKRQATKRQSKARSNKAQQKQWT
jgi:hypothetical protein